MKAEHVGTLGPRRAAGTPARQQSLKRHNLALVLRQVAARRGVSRAQLAKDTGLTKATVSSLVDALTTAGLLVEGRPARGPVGRPGSPVALDPEGPAGLGVEVNVDYVAACVVDLTGEVRLRRVVVGDNRGRPPEAVLRRAAEVAESLRAEAERAGLAVAGTGVAVPGLVDADGLLRLAPNLPGWSDLPVGSILRDMVGRPGAVTHVGNEADFAALGELWFGFGGPATPRQNFVHVSGEIGVGAGIVVDGRLFRGVRGFAGELGHTVVDPRGPACGCGSNGCLEQLAGQEALLRAAGVIGDPTTAVASPEGSIAELVRRARTGDLRTLSALQRAGQSLGIALSALVNLVDLPTVVLGGLYAQLAPWLRDPIAVELRRRVVSHSWSPVQILVSTLGADAAVRGAAASVVQRILDDPAAWAPGLLASV